VKQAVFQIPILLKALADKAETGQLKGQMNFESMRFYLMILFLIILLSCKQNDTHGKIVNKDSMDKEKLRYTLINDTLETKWIIGDNGFKFWQPNKRQILLIDSIILGAVTNNYKNYYRHLKPDSISKFYRQYVCYIDSNGDSIVFVNALCHILDDLEFDKNKPVRFVRGDWQNHLMMVDDGGDCFWSMQINYTKKEYFRFSVNGQA
jgi:hypothetical protein